jgi:ADP-ribose pyrophosphatase YjhB (NUDIX family)
MSELVHEWVHDGRVTRFCWLGLVDVVVDRVYAFAFLESGDLLLVSDAVTSPACWLPGGGVERGESVEQALRRELLEEANATVVAFEPLGVQRAVDPVDGVSLQSFCWARVELSEEYVPAAEVTERWVVGVEEFLDHLFWGRSDPKAEVLLARAVGVEARYRSGGVAV